MSIFSRIATLFKHACTPDSFSYVEDGARYAVCTRCLKPVELKETSDALEALGRKVAEAVASHPTYVEGKKQRYVEPKKRKQEPKSPSVVKFSKRGKYGG